MKRFYQQLILGLLSCGLVGLVTFGFYVTWQNQQQNLKVVGTQEAIFHDRTFKIGFKANNELAKIYYTLDGAEPTPENGFLYSEPLIINVNQDQEVAQALLVRARAFSRDLKRQSNVWTKTYFYGHDINDRFTTMVVALATDPVNLYSYEKGIFVDGKLRYDYLALHPELVGLDLTMEPAGYNLRGRESEREVEVEFIENKQVLFAQKAGMRIHGFGSRSSGQKSLALIARKEYDANNGRFKYLFFDELTSGTSTKVPLDEFNKLLLRTSNSDAMGAFIRDDLGNYIFKATGFADYQASIPVAVFLNGQYYGFSWLKNAYDEKYLQTKYQTDDDNFQILEITDTKNGWAESIVHQIVEESELTGFDRLALEELQQLIKADLRDSDNLEKLEALIDLDNLLHYYTLEIALSNSDWPYNNIKVWRYLGEKQVGTSLDGRWRFLAYDFDRILENEADMPPVMELIIDEKKEVGQSGLLINILQNKTYQAKFVNLLQDWRLNVLTREKMDEFLQQQGNPAKNEINYAIEHGELKDLTDEGMIDENRQRMIDLAEEYSELIFDYVVERFSLRGEVYQVKVEDARGGQVRMSGLRTTGEGEVTADLRGEYFKEYEVEIAVEQVSAGFEFKGWQVNGEKIEEGKNELKLNSKMADRNGEIVVRPIIEKVMEVRDLELVEIYNWQQNDWIKVRNPNVDLEVTLNLYDYCLTDDEQEKCRWVLPKQELASGEEMIFYSSGNKSEAAWRNYMFSFNLGDGEDLILSKLDGDDLIEVGRIRVPRMKKNQLYQYDEARGIYVLHHN